MIITLSVEDLEITEPLEISVNITSSPREINLARNALTAAINKALATTKTNGKGLEESWRSLIKTISIIVPEASVEVEHPS